MKKRVAWAYMPVDGTWAGLLHLGKPTAKDKAAQTEKVKIVLFEEKVQSRKPIRSSHGKDEPERTSQGSQASTES